MQIKETINKMAENYITWQIASSIIRCNYLK